MIHLEIERDLVARIAEMCAEQEDEDGEQDEELSQLSIGLRNALAKADIVQRMYYLAEDVRVVEDFDGVRCEVLIDGNDGKPVWSPEYRYLKEDTDAIALVLTALLDLSEDLDE